MRSSPHWVNTCDRLPDNDKEVYVLVVRTRKDSSDIGYAKVKRSHAGWVFVTKSPYEVIVAWIEADNISLSESQLSSVPKDMVRF